MTPCRSSTADHSVILKIVVAGCHCEYLCASWPWWFWRFWWPWCPVPWALSGHNLRKRAWPSGLGLPSYHTLTIIILLWSQLIRLDQRQSEILILRPSQEVDERNTLFSGHSCHTGQSWSKVYTSISSFPESPSNCGDQNDQSLTEIWRMAIHTTWRWHWPCQWTSMNFYPSSILAMRKKPACLMKGCESYRLMLWFTMYHDHVNRLSIEASKSCNAESSRKMS